MKEIKSLLSTYCFQVLLVVGLVLVWLAYNQGSQQAEADFVPLVESVESSQEVGEEVVDSALNASEPEDGGMIYVDLKGAVVNPQVYALEAGSRLFDVIEAAGGFLDEAAVSQVNLAQKLEDQMMIYIYTESEWAVLAETSEVGSEELMAMTPVIDVFQSREAETAGDSHRVNINAADKEQLMTLPGIGPKKADAIIQYRQEHGSFGQIEDIMLVSGIGEKTFAQLAELIQVEP